MSFNTIEEMIAASAAGVRPPERLTVAQAAEKYRFLNNPGSYVGPWDNKIAPYLVEPMEVLTSDEFTGMIFAGPARTGKSDMAFNWIGYTAKCDPADMMMVNMTINTARDWSQKDLRRMFRHSKEIGALVAPGRQNLSTHSVRFMSGMHLLIKWPTITELSGKTSPRNWLFDYDRMPESVDGEGSPYDLTAKRAQTFGQYGMTVAESSPGWEIENPNWMPSSPHEAPPTRGILALYNRGDRRRYYWRCPHCRTPFEPDFKLLVIPDSTDMIEAAEATVLACPHCGGVMWHDGKDGVPGKHEMNQPGNARWVKDGTIWLPDGSVSGKPYRSDIASFWMKGPCAAFMDWRGLVLKYLKAEQEYERTGSQEALKTTVNTDQGLPYTPKMLETGRLPELLKARAVTLPEKTIPEGVRFLEAAIDVQKNRFEVQVMGFGVGGDITIIDRFAIRKSKRLDDDGERWPVNPGSYLEDWYLLIDEVILKSYPLDDDSGRRMSIKIIGCDSGGRAGVTSNAYNFWRLLRDGPDDEHPLAENWTSGLHKRFWLTKGASHKSAPRLQTSYPDSERKDRNAGARGDVPVLFINTDLVKDSLNQMLERRTPGGGMINFPKWLPDEFYSELCVEVRTPKGWQNPKSLRNEAWDLLVYAIALSLHRDVRLEHLSWDDPPGWASDWDDNDLVFEGEVNKRFAAKQKGGYDLSKLAEQLA